MLDRYSLLYPLEIEVPHGTCSTRDGHKLGVKQPVGDPYLTTSTRQEAEFITLPLPAESGVPKRFHIKLLPWPC